MVVRVLAILALSCSLFNHAAAYADPGACSGQCWSHDPSLIRRSSDGTYFRFETGSRIGIWKSPSISGPWAYQGKAVPNGSVINLAGNTDLWAPSVHQVGDKYVMYYSVSTFGSQNSAIGFATSPTMEAGTWVDGGATGIASSRSTPFNAIDASLVLDAPSSTYYVTFGSFWRDIYQVAMNSDGTRVAAAAGASSSSSYRQVAYNASSAHALEGSFLYYRDGLYYLFFSSGTCCGYDTKRPPPGEEYKIFVCRSGVVGGPFVDRQGKSCLNGGGTLVLESHGLVYGPGGQGVMDDPEYGSVLYYHYGKFCIAYETSQMLMLL